MNISLETIAKRLNPLSWDILQMLSKTEFLSYGEIREKLKVSQDKASKEIARLEGGALIDSRRDDIDQRVVKFCINEYGLQIMNYKK